MENMYIYDQTRVVPSEALKAIQGGRLKGMSDINPMWRIKKLTEMFGPCGIGWRIETVDSRIVDGHEEERVCFVDINLFIKVDGEWSYPIPGTGGSAFTTKERNGVHTSDECFKMAYTDAISVACKMLGIAADVYFEKDRTKYNQDEERNQESNNKKEHDRIMAEIKGKWNTLSAITKTHTDDKERDAALEAWMEKMVSEKNASYADINATLADLLAKAVEKNKKEQAV